MPGGLFYRFYPQRVKWGGQANDKSGEESPAMVQSARQVIAEPDPGGPAPFLPDPGDPAVVRCTSMFNRVLASWASDLLSLKREGLATPGWRERIDGDGGLSWRRAA